MKTWLLKIVMMIFLSLTAVGAVMAGPVVPPTLTPTTNPSTAFPASTNYQLEGFSLGNAGGGDIGSSNYSVNANVGEINGNQMVGNSYDLGAGLMFIQQSNVPMAASFSNVDNSSNKLHLIIDDQGNPSDTIYAVAISRIVL